MAQPVTSSTIQKASDITLENNREVIPQNKHDLDRVLLLQQVDPHIWAPIVNDLIDWTCDPNWPSSQVILPLLRCSPVIIEAAIPYVTTILRKTGPPGSGFEKERDDEHQNVLLHNFVMEIGIELQVRMLDVLKEFRNDVTDQLEADWEWLEVLDEIIGQIEDTQRNPKTL